LKNSQERLVGQEGEGNYRDQLSSSAAWLLIATLCAVQFVDVLGTTVVIVALPAIQADLGLSAGERELVAAIYALLFGALLLLAGRLADAWGARRLFMAGLLTFGVGSTIGGLAPNGLTLIVGRGVQGIGAALAVPAALAMVASLSSPGAQRNRVLGYWAATGAAGSGAGFAFGGVITDLVSWRWTLLLNVPVILAATMVMLLIRIPEATRGRIPIPLIPSLTLTAGLLVLMLGLTNGQTQSLNTVAVILPILLGLTLLGVFAHGEHGDRPLVPCSAWRNRALLSGSAVAFTLTFTTTAGAVLLTLYLQQIEGVSAAATGWVLLPFSVAVVVVAPLGSRLVSRWGAMGPMQWGLIGVAASQAIHIVALGMGSVLGIVIGMTLSGAALGVASVAATSHGLAGTSSEAHGTASGLLNAAARVGTALGIAIYGIVAAMTRSTVQGDDVTATVLGYQAAHLTGIVLIVAILMLIRTSLRS
jgi:MFS family permease